MTQRVEFGRATPEKHAILITVKVLGEQSKLQMTDRDKMAEKLQSHLHQYQLLRGGWTVMILQTSNVLGVPIQLQPWPHQLDSLQVSASGNPQSSAKIASNDAAACGSLLLVKALTIGRKQERPGEIHAHCKGWELEKLVSTTDKDVRPLHAQGLQSLAMCTRSRYQKTCKVECNTTSLPHSSLQVQPRCLLARGVATSRQRWIHRGS